MKKILLISYFLCFFAAGCCESNKTREKAKARTQREYLIFAVQQAPLEKTRESVLDFRNFYGANDPDSNRLIGFSRMTIMLFKHSIEEMRYIVNKIFDIAEELDMPAYIHLDMLHNPPVPGFEGPDKKFFDDPMMCEWVDFPCPGEKHGRVPRYWNNWGAWFSAPAFPSFASQKLQLHVKRQLRLGVLEPLIKRVKKLKEQDRYYLFAGINIGWETAIYSLSLDDPYTPPIDPNNPPVDKFLTPPVKMKKWEMAQLGYASLHHLGYDQKRLELQANERGITSHELFRQICYKVCHDYTQMLAEQVYKSGIEKDKIYSHIVATQTVDQRPSTNRPPIWTAVNPYCIPGFTMDNFGAAVYDLEKLKEQISMADPQQDNFVVAETYFKKGTTEKDYDDFFNNMFDNGAKLIHILAWHEGKGHPDSPYYVPDEMKGPHLSVINWLKEK